MKKIYYAPYLKVVEVKNDIIATSTGYKDEPTLDMETQGRRGMWDEDFDGEDLY